MNKVKTVIFDLDGTLASTSLDMAKTTQRVLEKYGVSEIDQEIAERFVGNGISKYMQRMREFFGISEGSPEEDTEAFLVDYDENCCVYTTLRQGVKDVLCELSAAGLHIAVATMKARTPALRIIRELEIDSFASFILTGDEMHKPKPDPWFVFECAKHFDCDPEECMMVGDALTDVNAAVAAEAVSVAVLGGYCERDAILKSEAKYKLETMEELLTLPELGLTE